MSVNDRDERETAYSVHFKDVFAAINIIVPSDHEKQFSGSNRSAGSVPIPNSMYMCQERLLILKRRQQPHLHKLILFTQRQTLFSSQTRIRKMPQKTTQRCISVHPFDWDVGLLTAGPRLNRD